MSKKMICNFVGLGLVFYSSILFVVPVNAAPAPKCTYELVKDSVEVGWTAFKTSQKVGVNGSFKKIETHGKMSAKNVSDLAKGIEVSVDKISLDTGNPARDKTLSEFFFDKLQKNISGKIKNFSEKDLSFTLSLNFNGKTKDVPMHFEVKSEKVDEKKESQNFVATGSMNILDFGAEPALSSISEKCHDLHKGADGVSKTWPEVILNLKGIIQHVCK